MNNSVLETWYRGKGLIYLDDDQIMSSPKHEFYAWKSEIDARGKRLEQKISEAKLNMRNGHADMDVSSDKSRYRYVPRWKEFLRKTYDHFLYH